MRLCRLANGVVVLFPFQLIMQLLRDNLTLWTSDLAEPKESSAPAPAAEKNAEAPAASEASKEESA